MSPAPCAPDLDRIAYRQSARGNRKPAVGMDRLSSLGKRDCSCSTARNPRLVFQFPASRLRQGMFCPSDVRHIAQATVRHDRAPETGMDGVRDKPTETSPSEHQTPSVAIALPAGCRYRIRHSGFPSFRPSPDDAHAACLASSHAQFRLGGSASRIFCSAAQRSAGDSCSCATSRSNAPWSLGPIHPLSRT